MVTPAVIYRNKNNEEVARIFFDLDGVPGWRVKSVGEPGFNRKFAARQEACAVWLREFDPETGRLRCRSNGD